MRQPVKKLASVSFQDVDNDRDTDIILIVQCHNDRGDYQEESYKVGDVLFQDDGNFYRDYRISDKINRFDMNKNPACILNFVRDGRSREFFDTAETLADLLEKEALEAWDERKRKARGMGETAATKLLVPMIMMLVVVMAIIMIPAFLSFYG